MEDSPTPSGGWELLKKLGIIFISDQRRWYENYEKTKTLPVHARNNPEEVSLAAKLFSEGGEGQQGRDFTAQEGKEGQEKGPGVAVSTALLILSIRKFLLDQTYEKYSRCFPSLNSQSDSYWWVWGYRPTIFQQVFLHFGWQLTALWRPESLLDCVSEGNTVKVKKSSKREQIK